MYIDLHNWDNNDVKIKPHNHLQMLTIVLYLLVLIVLFWRVCAEYNILT